MSEPPKPNQKMSDYEARAWIILIERVGRREKRPQFKPIQKLEELTATALDRIEKLLDDHEQVKTVVDVLGRPLNGLQDLVARGAALSVSDQRVLRRAARLDKTIRTLDDLRRADLKIPDRLLGHHTVTYGALMAAEGGATSLVVTGAVVSSTVSGGTTLAAAAGAIVADVTANLAASARLVAKIAVSYGYDTSLPDEQLFALGVLDYGSSLTAGGKAASLGQLSRLVQTMMRHPTHLQLQEHALVQVTSAFFKLLGFKLTHQRLAQVIPFVGVVLNAGINAASITTLSERAQQAYRLRFLTEKYDMDAGDWLSSVNVSDADDKGDVIDLESIIKEAQHEGEPIA